MARAAAEALRERHITLLRCSPLQRAQESAAPIAEFTGLTPEIDERLIEPTNVFEGTNMKKALTNPANWWHLRRPSVPSWGEPYVSIVSRMRQAMDAAWQQAPEGEAVLVLHQAPIWLTHLAVAGQPLKHDPRTRRCALSSVTSFEKHGERWVEVGYIEPAATGDAVDVGAV